MPCELTGLSDRISAEKRALRFAETCPVCGSARLEILPGGFAGDHAAFAIQCRDRRMRGPASPDMQMAVLYWKLLTV